MNQELHIGYLWLLETKLACPREQKEYLLSSRQTDSHTSPLIQKAMENCRHKANRNGIAHIWKDTHPNPWIANLPRGPHENNHSKEGSVSILLLFDLGFQWNSGKGVCWFVFVYSEK